MRIGLVDVDGHNFPNIPLMKISAWHKAQGDDVEWYYPLTSGHMDRVYMSKVFSFTPDYDSFIDADEIVKLGYSKIITYILDSETGASFIAAGWHKESDTKGHSWNCKSRPREDHAPTCDKQRWAKDL